MAFQATVPSIGEIVVSPDILTINQPITIQVEVTESSAEMEYTWPYSTELYSGEEAAEPWP